MDCIPYINDLQIEIQILKDVRANGNCDIEQIDNQIKTREDLIDKCKANLAKLSDNKIEYRLYLSILNGLNPNKAVEKIANENYYSNIKPNSISGVWNYYIKMQKKLKK